MNIARDTADADIIVGEALTAGHFEQIHDQFAFAETVQKRRDRAEIQRGRAVPKKVRGYTVQFEHDDAKVFRPLRHLNPASRSAARAKT